MVSYSWGNDDNWKTLAMRFEKQGHTMEVKGPLGLSRTLVSYQALRKVTSGGRVSIVGG